MTAPFWRPSFWRRLFRRAGPESQPVPKTYIYVSDAKVDMLAAGLSKPLRDQFDLTVRGSVPGVASVEVGTRHTEASRYERVERLCKALEAQGLIGAVTDEASEYIRGTMLAVWGFWGRRNEGYADVVFFTSFVDESTLVGLGGSAYHTMERSEDRLQKWSNSGIRALMEFVKEQSEASADGHYFWDPPGAWDAETGDADHDNASIPEEIEFVAQRLLDEQHGGRRYIIGSPIYVARTGRPLTSQTLRSYAAIRDAYSVARLKRPRLAKGTDEQWQLGRPSSPMLPPLTDPDKHPLEFGRACDGEIQKSQTPPEPGPAV